MLLRTKDQSSNTVRNVQRSFAGLKTAIAGLAVGAGLKALIANMDEADRAATSLDAAFANTGKTVGLTRDALDGLATELQRTTALSDDLVKEAEAILLSFDRVRGEAFERTVKVAADLSTRLGTDLKSSIRQVGLALQDPVTGLSMLRRAGISFTDSQKNLIKTLVETGQASQAQNLILQELERRFGGAAQAARNTLGGALAGLKNAFGDLFEGSKQGSTGATEAINGLAAALQSEKLKGAIDGLIAGLAKVIELAVKGTSAIAGLFSGNQLNTVEAVDKKIADIEADIESRRRGGQVGRGARLAGEDENEPALRVGRGRVAANIAALREDLESLRALRAQLASQASTVSGGSEGGGIIVSPQTVEEVRVSVHRLSDEYGDVMREIEQSTRTAVQSASAEYIKLRTNLQFLREEGLIDQKEFENRLGGALDDILPEIDLNDIRAKYKTLKKETTELGEAMKGVWQEVGRSIQSTISDALYEWKLSWKTLIDITRRALADIAAAILTSGIKEALKSSMSGSKSSSSGGFIKALAGYFGFAAGGGRVDRPTVVGEEGKEIVLPPGRVMNQRQMAFAGGGGFSFSPNITVAIIEKDDAEKTKQEVLQTVGVMLSQQQSEFVRTLQRSGYQVRG